MKELIKALEDYSCVVENNGEIKHKLNEKGIKPLLDIYLNYKEDLKNSKVADKIIGKAGAFILILGEIEAVHAKVISKRAQKFLEKYNITLTYDTLINEIRNRQDTGMCPMEELVKDIEEPGEALEVILKFINRK